MARDRRDVENVIAFLPRHMGQCCGDAIQNVFDIDINRAVAIIGLAALQSRVRHQTGIVDKDADAAVRLHCAIDERRNLWGVRDIRFDCRFRRKDEFGGQCLQTIDAASPEHQLRAVRRQTASGRFTEPAACAGMTMTFPAMFSDLAILFADCAALFAVQLPTRA
jgi:hypothetical protein